ncbi:MAG: methyltransferase [Candidatus Lindowbacteria bacterium]|nr:methyltransferase [Candidatus Lindowbacteria bacterium]
MDSETQTLLRTTTGMEPLSTSAGIRALRWALSVGVEQVLIAEGDPGRIRKFLNNGSETEVTEKTSDSGQSDNTQIDTNELEYALQDKLKHLVAVTTRFDVQHVGIDESFENYGIDSILITRMNRELAVHFDGLSKTIFFEYQTIKKLADFFVAEFAQEAAVWTGTSMNQLNRPLSNESSDVDSAPRVRVGSENQKQAELDTTIAIIGMSGRYPMANNLDEFWENLKEGRDCISEVSRWSLDGFFYPDKKKAEQEGGSYSKWGGFIERADEFDPLFFNIAPRDARKIDPQERLFVQSCWEVLEDAGYTRRKIAEKHEGRVGVYAAITKTGYSLYGPDYWREGQSFRPFTSFSSVANRVSYLLDLKGPSMPIDTMCSSSLTAIHQACQELRLGHCELAIVGAVNLYLHPSNYVELCSDKMLSEDGKCRSFGADAAGFVPGEGVGSVLLKPLAKAKEDGDHIYALIRGSAINHGGKTMGYTVPNPSGQGEVVRAAIDDAGISARSVSYIECHGTGTELGDPIEIVGLTQAFAQDSSDKGYCQIGSIKTNIGHLEAAAGMAALAKVVLQMRNKKLVPSLHAEKLNPHIDFDATPFSCNRSLANWKPDHDSLIAGISSFGAGGSNAHIVIEEYCEDLGRDENFSGDNDLPFLIPVSARTELELAENVRKLVGFLRGADEKIDPVRHRARSTKQLLLNIAWTLQTGREAMNERLAVKADSIQGLLKTLEDYLEGKLSHGESVRGNVKKSRESVSALRDDEVNELIESRLAAGNYSGLLDLWVQGINVDLSLLYASMNPLLISLPTYAFARERYWIPELSSGDPVASFPKEYSSVLETNSDKESPGNRKLSEVYQSDWLSFQNEFDRAIGRVTMGQVGALGFFPKPEAKVADLAAQVGSSNGKWIQETMRMLERQNLVRFHDGNVSIVDMRPLDLESTWSQWDELKARWCRDSDKTARVNFVEAALRALPDILSGRRLATEILFPKSSFDLVEGIYKSNAVSDYFNDVLTDSLELFVQERIASDPNARIRIIEVGAGTGGTTAGVLRRLQPYSKNIEEYCYTDISKSFLMYARKNYGSANPYLSYKIFDAEIPLAGQEMEAGTFDVLIATHVLHVAKDMHAVMRNVKALLKTNGILLLNEMGGHTAFTHLTFGLLSG